MPGIMPEQEQLLVITNTALDDMHGILLTPRASIFQPCSRMPRHLASGQSFGLIAAPPRFQEKYKPRRAHCLERGSCH